MGTTQILELTHVVEIPGSIPVKKVHSATSTFMKLDEDDS